ncbi:MAG: oligopeptidase B [Rhodothermaceae bacterium]|nr:MAG: oligopeptidase B [Rhodothermaceae bacterium]
MQPKTVSFGVLGLMLALPVLAQTPIPQPHAATERLTPPDAPRHPVELTHHGVTRIDPYYGLRERDNPEVIAYLEAENAYTEAALAPVKELEDSLFHEILGRIKQDDASVPYRKGDFFYYTRYEPGKEYPILARRRGTLDAPEEILLDVNELAKDHTFYQLGGTAVSDDGRLLAFAADTLGRRLYTVYVKNLETGQLLPETLYPTTGNVVWAADNQTLFYGRQDLETLRSYQILRHRLGTDPAADVLVYQEDDPEFYVRITRSKSDRYLLIAASQTTMDEVRYLDAADPEGAFRVLVPRRRGHEYGVDHAGDFFYIRTNAGGRAPNFKLVRAPAEAPEEANWEDVVPHRDDVFLEDFSVFKDFLAVQERADANVRLRVQPLEGEPRLIAFDEPAYAAMLGTNVAYDTPLLRFVYTSLTTPASTFDYDMRTGERTLLKQEPVLGDFSPEDYVTERLYATASDGTRIPISLVRRRDTPVDGTAPLLLYGYGSYGFSMTPSFSTPRLSLLDRGFIYAVAHVRGGQENGRRWYEEGKLLKKRNTFTDFIAAAEYLVAHRYAHPEKLFAMGRSAGGLLMGAVVNLRPDLFRGVVAGVPFVDVVTTMLDETIPLTTFEYDEWGNPNDSTYFHYMLSYSPYDNVQARAYPAMLVTAGLHDSQVQYWEPAKWVARLRDLKTDDNLLLLKTNMAAGHGGASGRFQRYREIATEYAFLIGLAEGRL